MNQAARGGILVAAAVLLGALILGQGFDSPSFDPVTPINPVPGDADDGGGDDGSGDDGSDDSQAAGDDAATSDDGTSGDDSADDGDDSAATGDDEGSGDDGAPAEPTVRDPSEVKVVVANGTLTSGAAGDRRQTLIVQAYNAEATNATNQGSVDVTAVYYQPDYLADAGQVASILGISADALAPMPADPPVADLQDAQVLVVLGTDVVGA